MEARLEARLEAHSLAVVNSMKKEIALGLANAAVSIGRSNKPPPKQPQQPREYESNLDELADLFSGQESPESQNENVNDDNPKALFYMKPKHQSLRSLYEEWYGLGDYCDGTGGVDGRNKRQGARWRAHINRQHYSRCSRIVSAIDTTALQNSSGWETAVKTLESMFQSSNCSLSKMVLQLQEAGVLQKGKTRGIKGKSATD